LLAASSWKDFTREQQTQVEGGDDVSTFENYEKVVLELAKIRLNETI